MPHFRVDDGLNNHPKARKAGLEAMGLWSLCGSYCMAYLTNGFVPEWYVQTWPKGILLAKRLVSAGFWYAAEQDGERGFEFHEFLGPGRQDSREKVEADRELARKRKAKSRGSRGESRCDSPRDEHRESRRSPGYTQPNPVPEETVFGYVGNAANESNARGPAVPPAAWALVKRHVSDQHPQANRTDLALQAAELLNAGTAPDLVEAAIERWANTPSKLSPKGLRLLVSDVIRERENPAKVPQNDARNGLPPATRKVNRGLELATKFGNQPPELEAK